MLLVVVDVRVAVVLLVEVVVIVLLDVLVLVVVHVRHSTVHRSRTVDSTLRSRAVAASH